jgi:DNA-binding response OmpR family regulator
MCHSTSTLKILVADDDKEDQHLLMQAFKENEIDCDLVPFYNGRQLMDYLLFRGEYKNDHHTDPDFIVLDINMPLQNGFEVLREIQENMALQNIPIYIFTTSHASEDRSLAIGLGATKFFTKPDDFKEIKKIVREIVPINNLVC